MPSSDMVIRSSRSPRRAGRRSIPQFPSGWYVVCASREIPPSSGLPAQLCGNELVVYRSGSGAVVVLDAHCPHLGAHLGHGGVRDGEGIRCPFHRWRFGSDGRCDSVPYLTSGEVPDVGLRSWPCVEQHGLVIVYHEAEGAPPTWCPLPQPDLLDGPWSDFHRVSHDISIHCQDVVENLADTVHFYYVHQTTTIPIAESSIEGAVYRQTMIGVVDGVEEYRNHFTALGLGLLWLEMRTLKMFVLTTATPLDEQTTRFTLWFTAWEGDGGMTPERRARMIEVIAESTYRDVPIWENRVYPERPRLVRDDGPIGLVQRWAQQFYPS